MSPTLCFPSKRSVDSIPVCLVQPIPDPLVFTRILVAIGSMFVSLNGRPVRLKAVARALAASGPAPRGRFAIGVLDFAMAPDTYDVNLTPDKSVRVLALVYI